MRNQTIIALFTIASVHGAEHKLEINIPQKDVSEYHRPYVSVWIQNQDRSKIENIAVWYQMKKDSTKGQKWLKDLRKWWRVSGRKLDLPIDGVTSPTRPPGKHTIDITEQLKNLPKLSDGEYTLYVEASREVGGREVIKIPLIWDGEELKPTTVKGSEELNEITILTQPEK